jgi:hypothetical protein
LIFASKVKQAADAEIYLCNRYGVNQILIIREIENNRGDCALTADEELGDTSKSAV